MKVSPSSKAMWLKCEGAHTYRYTDGLTLKSESIDDRRTTGRIVHEVLRAYWRLPATQRTYEVLTSVLEPLLEEAAFSTQVERDAQSMISRFFAAFGTDEKAFPIAATEMLLTGDKDGYSIEAYIDAYYENENYRYIGEVKTGAPDAAYYLEKHEQHLDYAYLMNHLLGPKPTMVVYTLLTPKIATRYSITVTSANLEYANYQWTRYLAWIRNHEPRPVYNAGFWCRFCEFSELCTARRVAGTDEMAKSRYTQRAGFALPAAEEG